MSTGKPATFSAVLLNYNHSAFVLKPLNTVINQTHPFDEILIIDDASTDNSAALTKRSASAMYECSPDSKSAKSWSDCFRQSWLAAGEERFRFFHVGR